MAVEQDDIDMALTTFLTSVLGTIVSTGQKPSEAFESTRRVLDELEAEAKKDETYE